MQLSLSLRNGRRFRKAETKEEEAALLLNLLAVTSVMARHPTLALPAGEESGEPICRAPNQPIGTVGPHVWAMPCTEEPSRAVLAMHGGAEPCGAVGCG